MFFTTNCVFYKSFELSTSQGCQTKEVNQEIVDLFKKTYVDFFENNKLIENSIPKIIHFIWVGGKLPYIYNFCIDSWKRHHPQWQVILWDDNKLETLSMQNRSLFDALTNNGAKADVARYEILSQMGGFYVDIDFFCQKPLDFYAERASLFLGTFLPDVVGNGIIGASSSNSFICDLLDGLGKIDYRQADNLNSDQIMSMVGPHFVRMILCQYLKNRKERGDIALLPSSYLHPFPNLERDEFWGYKKSLVDIIDNYVYPETIAIHLWSVSWVNRRIDKYQNAHTFCQALDIAGSEFTSMDVLRKTDGATALHLVAQRGSIDHIKSLLLAGADINALDQNKNTPLIYAINAGNINNARALMSFGANEMILNNYNQSAIDLIKKKNITKLLKVVKNKPEQVQLNNFTLIEAVKSSQAEVVESLLRHGYKVDVCDKNGKNSLFYASINNDLKILKLLTIFAQ